MSGTRRARMPVADSRVQVGAGAAALLVVLATVGAAFLVSDRSAEATAPIATDVPITSTDLVCAPAPSTDLGAPATTYGVARAVVGDGGSDGTLTAGAPGAPSDVAVAPGAALAQPADPVLGVIVRGRGAQAQGLFGWRDDSGKPAPCVAPRSQWWFTDAGAGLDHASVLILTNPDPGAAIVDLRVLGASGEADVSVGGKAVTIESGATVRIDLTQLAPGLDDLTIGVDATRGRVAAFVSDRLSASGDRGYDWIPAQEEPAKEVDVVGITGTPRSRTLFVANPSTSQAVVTIETASANGRAVPGDIAQQAVDPGALLGIDLASVLPGEAYTLRVISSEPVIAGVRSIGDKGLLIHAAAATAIDSAAALPVIGQTIVQLTAGPEQASAVVRAFDANGAQLAEQPVDLPAFTAGPWLAPAGSAYVVVVPKGTVEAAAVYARASVPVASLPVSISVPEVRPAG